MNRKQRRAAARSRGKGRAPERTDNRLEWFAEHAPQLRPYAPDPEATCPDCGACFDQAHARMVHRDGCPIHRDYEAASDADREWFRAHPGETVRRRVPTMGEIQQQMLMAGIELPDFNTDVSYEPAGVVVVRFVADGVRVRDFSGSMLVANLPHAGTVRG